MPPDASRRGAPSTTGWQITPAAFDRLLGALHADREQAALAYEGLRRRTLGLLQWWGASPVEDLTDRVFDRVARKLEEGAVIPDGSLGAYVRGVARMVFYESTRTPRPSLPGREPIASMPADDADAPHACLDSCLASLPQADRQLALRYYGDGPRPEMRRRLADELGVSMTALRVRTHRLRERLEGCVTGCVETFGDRSPSLSGRRA